MALSGDTALIGAPAETARGKMRAGAAYLYTGAGASWTRKASLSVSNPNVTDDFGWSVALSGDRALIGARFKTLGRLHRTGAAYLFARSGATWRRQATLHAFDPGSFDNFGHAVAVSGDTVLVGAPYTTVARKSGVGAAYVFVVPSETQR